MRAALLVALLVLTTATLVAMPTAQARDYCTVLDPWCPGIYCKYDPQWRVWRCADIPEDCVQFICLGP